MKIRQSVEHTSGPRSSSWQQTRATAQRAADVPRLGHIAMEELQQIVEAMHEQQFSKMGSFWPLPQPQHNYQRYGPRFQNSASIPYLKYTSK